MSFSIGFTPSKKLEDKYIPTDLFRLLTEQNDSPQQSIDFVTSESTCTQDYDYDQNMISVSSSSSSIYSTTNLNEQMLRYFDFCSNVRFDEISYKIEQNLFYEKNLAVSVCTFLDFLDRVDKNFQVGKINNVVVVDMMLLDSGDLDVESAQVSTKFE